METYLEFEYGERKMIFGVLFIFIAVAVIVFVSSLLFSIFMDDINNPFLILWLIESFILSVLISMLICEMIFIV